MRYELDVTDRTVTILECRPASQPEPGPSQQGSRLPG
jgi:hypothetical protein